MSTLNNFKSFLSNLRIAISGSEKEFTTGSINRAIFMLSVPMILEMVMESLFAVVDVFFVSRVSINAIATVGLTESVIFLVYAVAIGLSIATTAMVARRVGEKRHKKAADAAVQAIVLAVILSILIGIIGFLFAKDILFLMGASDDLISEGYGYTKWLIGGNVTITLLFLLNAVFRGAGEASLAMRSLWLANGLNIILDPLLIFGLGPFPELGIEGAAIATNIGRGTGVLFQLYILFRGSSVIKIKLENNHILCIIEDNGIGRKYSAELRKKTGTHTPAGMKITKERLEVLNLMNISDMHVTVTDLFDEDNQPSGTMVEVSITPDVE